MRFRYILPAALLTAGSAFAQAGAPTPNAVGVWNSQVFGFFGWYIGTGFPAGTAGNKMWQSLPPELTTFYRNGSALRELDFRGVEMNVTQFGSAQPLNSPRFQVRNSVPGFAGGSRWTPGATVYVDMASVAGGVNATGLGAGTTMRIALTLNPGNAVAIPTAPGGQTEALVGVYEDFQMELGDGFGLFMVATSTEPTAGVAGLSYSGGSTNTGQNFIVPNIPFSGEYVWTWLFEQSMIQSVVNSSLISAGGQILGGGPPPAGVFTVQYNDGRGAIHPVAGDGVSYNGNSSYGNGDAASVWFAPFTLFSGDVAAPGVSDPFPEVWNTGPAFIYQDSVQTYIDDICLLTGNTPVGASLNPLNSFHGLWLGTDLPTFLNVTALLNGIAFADVSSGFQWAGPTVKAYDSTSNPGGLMGRNLTQMAGYVDTTGALLTGIREHRTLISGPQSGWTPLVVNAAPSTVLLGFGVYPGALAGQTFSVQCWMLDMTITQIVDTTNVSVTRLQ